MPFSMSASFSNFVADIYFHLINEQLRKRGVCREHLHSEEGILGKSMWQIILVHAYESFVLI